jgi:hypothetical protein
MQDDHRSTSDTVPFVVVQIVAGALIAGVVIFAIVAIALTVNKPPGDALISLVGLAISAAPAIAAFFVPRAAAAATVKRTARQRELSLNQRLFLAYQTLVIVRSALLEGISFLNTVLYMVTAHWWSLAAAAVMLGLMIVTFPTRSGFDQWAREQREMAVLDDA